MAFKNILDAITGRKPRPDAPDPAGEVAAAIDAMLAEVKPTEAEPDRIWSGDAAQTAAGRALLEGPPDRRLLAAKVLFARTKKGSEDWLHRELLRSLGLLLLRKKLPIAQADVVDMLASVATLDPWSAWQLPFPTLLALIEKEVRAGRMALDAEPPLRVRLEHLRTSLRALDAPADHRKLIARIDRLLGEGVLGGAAVLEPGGLWSEAVFPELEEMEEEDRARWVALFDHALLATQAKPSRKWLDRAEELTRAIGDDAFRHRAADWLALGPTPNAGASAAAPVTAAARVFVSEKDSQWLKGLVWAAMRFADGSIAEAVGRMADECFRNAAEHGAISARVGNACVIALAAMPGMDAVQHLSRLRDRVKYAVAHRFIVKALEEAAERAGVAREELEDLAVPSFAIEKGGLLRRAIGDWRAEARFGIGRDREAEVTWVRFDGGAQKSVPADVKTAYPLEVKAFQRTLKEIDRTLAAQRARLERLETFERVWPLARWRERMLEHPVTALLARRLIWRVRAGERDVVAGCHEDGLVDADDRPIEDLGPDAEVRLWHPIVSSPEEVQRWRKWLEARGITQPFRQAHRAVHAPSPDEVASGAISSERFAGHVLRQHAFAALCHERGWVYRLKDDTETDETPHLPIPKAGLRAQWKVAAVGDDGEMSASGIFLHLTTNDLTFVEEGTGILRKLADVPPLAFSEAMRDAELFVGVCGIASDPSWAEPSATPTTSSTRYGDYWRATAFGPLDAQAVTRRETLRAALQRTKLAERVVVEERELIVRGKKKTVRIHLGTGNVKEEDGTILPLSPDRRAVSRDPAGRVYLPYEGDAMLNAILAKVLTLTTDEK